MNMFIRLMLLIAALAYGAMPISGAAAMAVSMAAMSADVSGSDGMVVDLGQHGMVTATADPDCPHAVSTSKTSGKANGAKMMPGGHCATCVTLAPQISFADAGKPARAAEAPGLSPRLFSRTLAPQVPPPRG